MSEIQAILIPKKYKSRTTWSKILKSLKVVPIKWVHETN